MTDPAVAIDFVGHASFVVTAGETRIICDPWLGGLIFHNGWDQYATPMTPAKAFASASDIWISHEHPDHFSTATLKAIPEAQRANIRVWHQQTLDKKLVGFCKALRFKDVIEMPDAQWLQASPDLSILCKQWSNGDSWCAYRTLAGSLLNINDCVIVTEDELESIKALVGAPRVLFTQFSYANWCGNPNDHGSRARAASEQRERLRLQAKVLQPQYAVPFASFIYFCHEENFDHNDHPNNVEEVASLLERGGTQPIVLYPGDRWVIGGKHDRTIACQSYKTAWNAAMLRGPTAATTSVPLTELHRTLESFLARTRKSNPLLRFVPLPSTRIRLSDHGTVYDLTRSGLKPRPANSTPDVELSSESLYYALRYPWGAQTLYVNARFKGRSPFAVMRFFLFFLPGDINNRGHEFDIPFIWEMATRTIKHRSQRLRRKLEGRRRAGPSHAAGRGR